MNVYLWLTWRYVITVLIGVDVLVNAIFGGRRYHTLSCRIGISIEQGGWASKVKWPEAFRRHCIEAIHPFHLHS